MLQACVKGVSVTGTGGAGARGGDPAVLYDVIQHYKLSKYVFRKKTLTKRQKTRVNSCVCA